MPEHNLIEEIEYEIKHHWVLFGAILLILLVFVGIFMFAQPSKNTDLMTIRTSNYTSISSYNYYKNSNILSISGWESKLNLNDKEDRLFGKESYRQIITYNGTNYTTLSTDNGILIDPLTTDQEQVTKIGWFVNPNQTSILETNEKRVKKVSVDLYSEKLNSGFNYYLFRQKPYLKIGFSASSNEGELGMFAYGLILSRYNIYTDKLEVYNNDYRLTETNQTIDIILRENGTQTTNISDELRESVASIVDTNKLITIREGSTYEINNSKYELFYNPDKKLGIIFYSPNTWYFRNSFYWNVHWVYVPHQGNGEYPPLYVIVLEEPELSYDSQQQDWYVDSKKYEGYIMDYIYHVVCEIDSGRAEKFNINDYVNFKGLFG